MNNYPRPATRASLPGKLKAVDNLLWMRCFPNETALPISLIAILALLGLALIGSIGLQAAPALIFFAVPILLLWKRVQKAQRQVLRHFQNGCICPAEVVSLSPLLVAVSTDLSKGGDERWPVIKILRQPLERVPGRRFGLGDPLVAVALYHNSAPNSPHWEDFSPIVADCVTADERELARMRAALDAEPGEWNELTRNLATVGLPLKPGLHWVGPK